jgi:hypothetical protein
VTELDPADSRLDPYRERWEIADGGGGAVAPAAWAG